jgi:ATP-dependent Clp protease ATP-binding subunit ClpB
VTEEASRLIAREGFDPVYGARPLRRFIAHEVETRIGRALLGGDVLDGAVVTVDVEDGELQVRFQNAPDEHAAAEARRS